MIPFHLPLMMLKLSSHHYDWRRSLLEDIRPVSLILLPLSPPCMGIQVGCHPAYPWRTVLLYLFSFTATVHKSQGSEDPAGVIPLSTQHNPVLGRNLFDTGVTRGKQLVVIIGQPRSGVGGAHHEIAAAADPSLGPTTAALP